MARLAKPHRTSKGCWRFRFKGKQYLAPTRQEIYAKFHRVLAKEGRLQAGVPASLAGAVDRWLDEFETTDNINRLKDFIKFGASLPLAEIDSKTLTTYHRRLVRRKLARKTIIDRVSLARRVLVWAHGLGWITEIPPMPKMKRPVKVARDIHADALAKLFGEMPKRAGRLARFIVYTGCRPSEACGLTWRMIDNNRRVAVLSKHKTDARGKSRTIYLTDPAVEILKNIKNKTGYVFVSRLGRPYTVAGLRSIMRHACDRIRATNKTFQTFTPYQLRHTFAQLASEQIPEEVLSKIMGHSDVATTRIYYQIKNRRASDAAASLVLPRLPRILDASGSGQLGEKHKCRTHLHQANRQVS